MNQQTRSIILAAGRHDGQFRKYTGQPYIYHPIEVATIVMTVAHDENMICAAHLHDTLEDTCKDEKDRVGLRQQILYSFGEDVLDLVLDLTDISTPSDGNRVNRKHIDRLHTKAASARAKTVKLADLISNTSTITMHDPDFAKVYLQEKALLLDEALREGNADLWMRANDMIDKAMIQVAIDPRCKR